MADTQEQAMPSEAAVIADRFVALLVAKGTRSVHIRLDLSDDAGRQRAGTTLYWFLAPHNAHGWSPGPEGPEPDEVPSWGRWSVREGVVAPPGMTLRDWMAGQIVASGEFSADQVYALADSILARRDR